MNGTWTVRLVAASEQDYLKIVKKSAEDFGLLQAEAYAQTLALAIEALGDDGPETIGARERTEIGPGIFTLHAARRKRKASHVLVFRTVAPRTVEILRILNDRMDLVRHVEPHKEWPQH